MQSRDADAPRSLVYYCFVAKACKKKNPSLAVRHINTIPFLPEKILSTRFTVMEFNTQTKLEIRFSHKNVLPAQNITHFCLPLHLPNLELQL